MTSPTALPFKTDLSLELAGLRLRNPVMVASGTFGYGPEYADVVDLNRLGAIVVKGISLEPWTGNRTPRLHEVTGGLLNAIGLQNPGAEGFIATYLPFLRKYDVPVVVNIWGRAVEDYVRVAERLSSEPGIHALEVNISCPNIKEGGISFGTRVDLASQVIGAVRKVTRLPLIIKLSPNVSDIRPFARAAADEGADAISLINSFPAMAIDIETRRPVLANVTGGLSGAAIHPIAVKLVYEAAQAVSIPIIAMGGIRSAQEAVEFLIAGASAVAVGTATFADPQACLRVIEGLEAYLVRHRIASVRELIRTVRL
jgi:dihydroorotate dehydrogenase (NAD+) catalytic subunit